jgi:uncharacterized protein Yka (UPF0111/DUF47 family)
MPRLAQVFAPRDRVYFELFEEAGQNILQASDLLDRLLSNYPDSKALAGDILVCEQEGDRITHDIIDRLNHTFVISHHTVEINRLENEGDRITREAVASLFDGGIDPMVVIRWKDLFERLEAAIDATEHVANILEGIVIKNS